MMILWLPLQATHRSAGVHRCGLPGMPQTIQTCEWNELNMLSCFNLKHSSGWGANGYNMLQLYIIYIYYIYIYVPTMYTGATHGTTWYNKCLLDNGDIAVPPGRPDAGFAARSVSTASRKHIAAPWTRRKLWAKKAFVVGKPWENYGKI